MEKIKITDTVECRITGFRGIAIAKAEYLYESTKFLVQQKNIGPEGKYPESFWIPETQLLFVHINQ